LACGILASLGLRNVYKDMLNNVVSLIDHVVYTSLLKELPKTPTEKELPKPTMYGAWQGSDQQAGRDMG
jgi:hypothetical protein